jgi:hypothetical protein
MLIGHSVTWVKSKSQARQNKIIYLPNVDNWLTGVVVLWSTVPLRLAQIWGVKWQSAQLEFLNELVLKDKENKCQRILMNWKISFIGRSIWIMKTLRRILKIHFVFHLLYTFVDKTLKFHMSLPPCIIPPCHTVLYIHIERCVIVYGLRY